MARKVYEVKMSEELDKQLENNGDYCGMYTEVFDEVEDTAKSRVQKSLNGCATHLKSFLDLDLEVSYIRKQLSVGIASGKLHCSHCGYYWEDNGCDCD